ncbi:glycosyltransferase family 4 protein [Candidatus Collierbacteria bacterium]|nr:glycosyltransferase family 4 protein [Candidatus Collierbacteria bacterium]
MKKIAVIHNLTTGGAVRVLDETNRLLTQKYRIKIFSPPKATFRKNNIIQNVLDYLHYVYISLPTYYRRISREINDDGYDVAIIHHDTYLKAPFALIFLKIKSIYILHEPPREFHEPLYFHAPLIKDKLFSILRIPIAILDKISTKRASHVVVNSKFSKNKIDKTYGVKSIIIYPGFSRNLEKTIKDVKRKQFCLSVGSLLPYKGHDLTIKAIGMMSKKPQLVVVGNGREFENNNLKELAKIKGVRLRILEKVSDKKLKELYLSAKVYINSAYQEPFGLTSLEALSYGENLVTVDKCGTEELKEFFRKMVKVVNRTPESISEGINIMINKKSSAPHLPEIFSWGHYFRKLDKLV